MRKQLRVRSLSLGAATFVAALALTACTGSEDGAAGAAKSSNASASKSTSTSTATPTDDTGRNGGSQGTAKGQAASDSSNSSGSSNASGSSDSSGSSAGEAGDKTGYGQECGTNDLTWSARTESQAGGYILITAKAKSGITCVLSGGLPVVAFGSDGTQASNAEQVAGEPITLSGSKTVYAGVNPKTTNTDYGKELDSIIVAVSNDDPNPVSLKVGTITVDKPIVTNWHTSAQDAVPGDGS